MNILTCLFWYYSSECASLVVALTWNHVHLKHSCCDLLDLVLEKGWKPPKLICRIVPDDIQIGLVDPSLNVLRKKGLEGLQDTGCDIFEDPEQNYCRRRKGEGEVALTP